MDTTMPSSTALHDENIPHETCVLPASFAQERLWFLDQFEPGSFAYNISSALRLRRKLNVRALSQSTAELARRHETLRTGFVAVNGRPQQSIASATFIPLPLVDLSAITLDEQAMLVQRIAKDEARNPFDLSQGPLLRTTLIRLHGEEHILVLVMHHIISDAWSMQVLLRELNTLYVAFAAGNPSPLPDLPIQYADYAAWQREWLQGEMLEQELAHWKQRLAGAPAVLELPTDYPRPPVQTYHGAQLSFSLPATSTKALEELSQKRGVTLFMTLLAAFQTLLFRLTGQQDIVVGTPIAGRTQIELEGLVGFFVNTLAIRCDLSGDPTFWDLLERVRNTALEAYAHQELPFDRVVEALQPERSLSYSPIIQVLFVLQNILPALPVQEASALSLEYVNLPTETAKFDLTLTLWKEAEEGGLTGALEYNTDMFERATIMRWSKHLQTLLGSIAADPNQHISALPLLSKAEQQRILGERSIANTSHASAQCIHHLFEAQVEQAPHAIALVSPEGEKLEYAELNRRANRLAHYLAKMHVGPEGRVGIYMERSINLIVGVLAILKAGAAYVPLDPAYPSERTGYILADAGVSALLAEQALLDRLPPAARRSTERFTLLCLDRDQELYLHEPETNRISGIQPGNLAYIIYTSGSTGKPKGVGVCHEHVARLFAVTRPLYLFSAQDCWTFFHSIAFDFSVWEIWGALLHGGRLVIVPYWVSRSPEEFIMLLQREQVTVLNQTPSAFYALQLTITLLNMKPELALRWVIFGGEALDAGRLRPWMGTPDDTHPRLVNMYGITETTVHVTAFPLSRATAATANGVGSTSVIGNPLPDMQIYLLDTRMQPVPPGVRGEMYIGGAGLARGYIGHPGLTAERFVPHPFSATPGARLYRTGDLARLLPDGTFAYQGRIDQQVKIHGFRIEPGEIEAALLEHPHVRAAAVVVRETNAEEDQAAPTRDLAREMERTRALVAYIVPEAGGSPTSEILSAYLHERLPEYMVPAVYMLIDALPVTFNGKLDQRALPVPEWGRSASRAYTPARTPYEKILADAWMRVLGVERIDVHANFFEAGGDSILSLLVIARARESVLVFTPKQIFQYQSIAELAKVAVPASLATNGQETTGGEIPLTPIQRWFFSQNLPNPHHWNQSVLLAVKNPRIDQHCLEQAIAHIVEHHSALTFRFKSGIQQWEQHGGEIEADIDEIVRFVDLNALQANEQERAFAEVAAQAQASLNLEVGPLMRAVYFAQGEQRDRLLLVIHHTVVDSVSWRILLEDLQTVCLQILRGRHVQLPYKTASFKTWAEGMQSYAQSREVRAEASYWLADKRRLVQPLPVDFAGDRSVNREFAANSVQANLNVEETDALLHETAGTYHTQIHELLLAALLLAYAPWAGRRKLLVDVEGHGREAVIEGLDISRTVGWFTTIFPVLLDLETGRSDMELGNVIKIVKEQVRGIPRNGIGYGLLRYMSNEAEIRAALPAMPQAEISFNYLGQFDTLLEDSADALFRLADEKSGPTHGLDGQRSHLLEVNGLVANGRFYVTWKYCTRLHRLETIEGLAQQYIETLRALIEHCRTSGGAYTPSDFSGSGLNQAKLDKIMAKIRSPKRTDL